MSHQEPTNNYMCLASGYQKQAIKVVFKQQNIPLADPRLPKPEARSQLSNVKSPLKAVFYNTDFIRPLLKMKL